jgi:hypothetical protein
MPRGANAKREREYRELKREFKKEGRYKGREDEVAARIVNKQRSRFGETKAEKAKDRKGKSPDRNLPISQYQHKTITQVERAMKSLSDQQLRNVERYEKEHKNRKTLLEFIHDRLTDGGDHHTNGHSAKSRRHSRHSKHRTSEHRRSTISRVHSSSPSRRSTHRRNSQSGRSSHRTRRGKAGKVTTDHDKIRRWVEERGGFPATVKATERRGDPGVLRIDFPGYSGGKSLERIDWDDFFDKFECANLAFLHQDRTAGGKQSRFNKFVSR